MKRTKMAKHMLRRATSRLLVLAPLGFLLVAGAGCPTLFEGSSQRTPRMQEAVPGRDGTRTISAADTVVNAYAVLNAGVSAGATAITVSDVATLATGFSAALAKGDLLLIIQMAGATINVTDTINYGSVTASTLGSAGRYEFAGVESVNSNQITLACPLKNDYTVSGKVQVIRVPQYTTLTIAAGGSITAPAWDGQTGGVVAVHAETTLQLDGMIDVSAKGFRGGAVHDSSDVTGATPIFRSLDATLGAEKGEGIAGSQADYQNTLNGRYGRGAPANGGGGGDSHNAGGGGGANARSGSAWSGQGVMLATVVGAAAWLLDPAAIANGNARTNSEGGGRGGYSYSNAAQDPLTVGPGNALWAGDNRREIGGLGGHPLDNDPTARLFMGGGGGAGDGNNTAAGRGGNGGGLVFVIAGAVAGAGSMRANGEAGANSSGSPGDAPGGGGGGGTVVVHAVSITGISISVDGGAGGNHTNSGGNSEVEGPGGGGGGGYIAVSGGTPTLSAAGGLGGTTNRSGMSAFPSDGATAGNAGQTNGSASVFLYCGILTAPDTIIATHPTDPSNTATGVFTFQSTEGAVTFECNLDSAGFAACPASFTTPALVDGSHTLSVRATDLSGNVDQTPAVFTWAVQLGGPSNDGGTLDVELDTGAVADAEIDTLTMDSTPDNGAVDVEIPLLDSGSSDVLSPAPDDGPSDVARDAANTIADVRPIVVVDAGVDTTVADAVFALLDSANDARTAVDSVQSEVSVDATASETNADVAPPPEPSPDAAVVPLADAATTVTNKDAGQNEKLVVLGSGFCSIASSQETSSAPFAFLALTGLALLLRRRRR
jgi:MYXO-CTERM domain-containing protein